MYRMLIVLLIPFMLFASHPAFAVRINSLYEASVPIAAQTDELKERAVKEAMMQVLMKLSGDPQIITNPTIKANIDRADYYVQEFSYASSTTSSSEYTIKVRFNREDVNRLLKKSQVPYWGDSRPLILIWLVVTNNKGADLIGNGNSGNTDEILQLIKTQSQRFGLPVIFPVLDVVDLAKVTPTDVAAMSISALREAGKRYEPDALLIGNMQLSEDGIQSQWQLVLNNNEQFSWALSEKYPKAVIATIMSQVSQSLAKHYVVNPSAENEQWVIFEVSNIKQRSDLDKLTAYFKELVSVQKVELSEIKGDVVTFAILIRGQLKRFQENTAINHHLQLKTINDVTSKLTYQWVN